MRQEVLPTAATEVEKDFQNHLANFDLCKDVTWISLVNVEKTSKNLSFWLSSGSLSNVVKHIELTSFGYFIARWEMSSHQTEKLMYSSPLQALV